MEDEGTQQLAGEREDRPLTWDDVIGKKKKTRRRRREGKQAASIQLDLVFVHCSNKELNVLLHGERSSTD